MDSAEIRSRFLNFFADRGHTVVPSASLLLDDPTLLLVNSGMAPFKPYFLGEAVPPYPRAVSAQKVVRTLDIDEVGKTTRHASFFQMCGNFSFGDYFKEKAIPYAWELLTNSVSDGGYGLAENKLWATVYEDDDESVDLWHRVVGVPLDRIQRRGMLDNYWSMGVPGPCGPCSEIYYDRGPEFGREGGPVVDEDRYIEVWNLVFMQFVRGEGPGKEGYPILGELPAKNIDTGMGLERMAAVLQGVDNIYEIDTTRVVLDRASMLTGKRYGVDPQVDVALRVVADHSRTCAFLVADGVLPANEGRGYVLRRILRRVVRTMRTLGAREPTIGELVGSAIESMAPQYPELSGEASRIKAICMAEETVFDTTLRTGTTIFDTAVSDLAKHGSSSLTGEQAFALHDTYGFPIELTLEMASEQGVSVDEEGFRRLMKEQRERAKADARVRKSGLTAATEYRELMESAGTTTFTGYDEVVSESTLRGLMRDGESVSAAREGDDVEVVLDRTPFYAEAGGQLGDHGRIVLSDGAVLEVYDVQVPVPGLYVHRARVEQGEAVVGTSATSEVDIERRLAISRAHTATHMIHKAFREALGDTATQMGSENAPGRLRFDFPSPTPVPDSVLHDVEARVNDVLLDDLEVRAAVMSQAEARAIGAMALFGEKYGDRVRVVSVGEWARELCGGTHTQRSGQLGVVKFLSEGSIGTGVRRVEALVGSDAYRFLAREHILLGQLAGLVKARPDELPDRISAVLAKLKDAERALTAAKAANLSASSEDILGAGEQIGDVRLWAFTAPAGLGVSDLRDFTLRARGHARADEPAALVGITVDDGRVHVVATVNPRGLERGLSANKLLQAALPAISGRGGGKDDVAQGGGTSAAGIPAAFAAVHAAVAAIVGG